ncbi:hypothetical protein HDE77_001835 [Rhodanobacter sp. MP7CTX1]|nr:hypothetical protein [Rhodanobacter sp. MP7CTX1]
MRLILVGMGKHRPASLSVGSLRLPGAGIAIHGTV